jgi:hypothetical protein
MDEQPSTETYSPWTVVDLVFGHLAEQGLHPTLGTAGNPGAAAADLLRALGISPDPRGDARITEDIRHTLAEMRARLPRES